MFRPTSNHLAPLYLNTNKSPLAAVVVNVGAVSSLNSYAAFHVNVLLPVPSCMTNNEINCPVAPLEALPNVLFAPNVTFATGLAAASQVTVDWSVNVFSVRVAPPEKVEAPVNVCVPVSVVVPVTVKLSATVVSDVVCQIVKAIPDVSVASFKAPTALVMYEFVPS